MRLKTSDALPVHRVTEEAELATKWFEIHFRGDLPGDIQSELGGLLIAVDRPRTVLSGRVRDQAALHGILRRLESLGIELVELRQFPDDLPPEQSQP
jgi:hypothetical protein